MGEASKSSFLILPMKKKWFDMVNSGEKLEEYREFKPYWMKRIQNWAADYLRPYAITRHTIEGYGTEIRVDVKPLDHNGLNICFKNGYGKKAPMFFAICEKIEVRNKVEHPEWGEDWYTGIPHFVLHIRLYNDLVSA